MQVAVARRMETRHDCHPDRTAGPGDASAESLSHDVMEALVLPGQTVVLRSEEKRGGTRRPRSRRTGRVLVGASSGGACARPRLYIRRNMDGTLELGPFFGISHVIPHLPPYGEQNRDFRLHMAVGRRRRRGLRVRPGDIDLRRQRRPGPSTTKRADAGCGARCHAARGLEPLILARQRKPRPAPPHTAQAHTARTLPFNPGVGTKWQVYRLLLGDPQLRRHVPATERYTGIQGVLRFARRYQAYI